MSVQTEGWTSTDCTLHWRRDGDGRPAVLMLHEMGGSLHSFDAAAELLHDSGCAIVRMDQRGFGESEKPRSPYGFDSLAQDALAVLDAAGVDGLVIVVGVAMGAAIAADMAIRFPDRVARLILGSPSLTLTPEMRAATRERAEGMLNIGMAQAAPAGLAAMYPPEIRGPEFEAYQGRYMANDPVGLALATRAFAEAELALETISQPTVLLAGEQDLRPVALVQGLTTVIPNAVCIPVPRAGHIMGPRAPEQIAACVREAADALRLRSA